MTILLLLFVAFGIPIILATAGLYKWSQQDKKTAKTLFIIATVYALICLGVCGTMLMM